MSELNPDAVDTVDEDDEPMYRIEVLFPMRVGDAVIDQIFDAVAVAAGAVEKTHPDRDWDVHVAGTGSR